jgi:predicted component of viral defense system (DUF524 family)
MAVKREVSIRINARGDSLRVWLLPKKTPDITTPPLVDLSDDPELEPSLEPIQLLESVEYGYEFQLTEPATAITTDRGEIFEPDTDEGLRGRLRPGLYTGRLPVIIRDGEREIGRAAFEVRSRKFDYLSHYRWMLRDIADGFAEVIMERFAPTEQTFEIDHTRDAATLYQRFAFLKALLQGGSFDAAIQHVLARPHRAWVTEEITRAPGQGIRATARVLRQLRQPGRRLPWDDGPVESLPARLPVPQTEETLDTPENRFVKFALTRWRDVVATIGRRLEEERDSQPVARGRSEVAHLVEQLDALLAADLFTAVGELAQFPAGSQVLQKRAGYRDIYRAYVQFEAAARLSWGGGDDEYGAGQRDVATLYEYWVFLQLAEAVSRLCQEPLDRQALLDRRGDDNLVIGLKQGRRKVMTGVVRRLGRALRLELWYNRSFNLGTGMAASWTRPMRPDYSLLIRPEPGSPGFEEIWLHFDAKYRVENLVGLFGGSAEADTDEEAALLDGERAAERRGAPKRTDLLKMHAYRDAIRRSAGAYVLYPGDTEEKRTLYHEILPGLGAFALRPSESGEADGIYAVQRFVDDVLTHVGSQVSQHERARFWEREVWREENRVAGEAPAAPFLLRPPADTLVLLGYVKDAAHLAWIHGQRRYNLRADGSTGSVGLGTRELAFELVLLYGDGVDGVELWPAVGEPQLVSREEMLALGYPNPRRALYYCARLADQVPAGLVPGFSPEMIERVRQGVKAGVVGGAPVVARWVDLVGLSRI